MPASGQHEQELEHLRRALMRSEQRFHVTIAHAPFPIMIYAEDGQVLELNHAWTQLSGYRLEDIPTVGDWIDKGLRNVDYWHQGDVQHLDDWHGQVEEGRYTIYTRDGSSRIWDFSAASLGRLPDGRRAVIRIAQDVTDRHRLEQALWETNRKAINILEAITDGFFALDRHWKIQYLNRRAEQLTGTTRETLLGHTFWEAFAPITPDSQMGQALRSAMDNDVEVHEEAPCGDTQEWFEMHIYPSTEGLAVYFRDVTERRRDQESLRRAEEKLRLSTDAGEVGLWEIPEDENAPLDWSPRMKQIFGLPVDRQVVRPLFWSMVHPEDHQRLNDARHAAIQVGSDGTYDVEFRIIRADGQMRWISCRGLVHFAEVNGRITPVRILGAAVDITARKVRP